MIDESISNVDSDLLAHHEHRLRRYGSRDRNFIGRLEADVKPQGIQVLTGQAKNFGIIEFRPGECTCSRKMLQHSRPFM